jgi:hypothetical protein
MERNPWKLATIGIAIAGTTALGSGLTTAWMLRPATEAQAQPAPTATAQPAVRYVTTPGAAATPAVARSTVSTRVTPAAAPAPTKVAATTVAADCDTGGERAMRIAKPGVIGALLGAGLGAGGGAIADGGKGAGKGALIGGLAGAALGAGYGAYKTKNECGTVFGDAFSGMPSLLSPSSPVPAVQPAATDRIQVYAR